MIDFSKLYENNRGLLKEVKKLIPNNLYVTEDGTRVRYLKGEQDNISFEIETTSPLVEGVRVSELSHDKGGLPLFWKLLNRKNEDTGDNEY